jgi:hypothetical protein
LTGFAYNNIPSEKQAEVLESTTLFPILETISELASTEVRAKTLYE